ncbi:ATP-binding cassette domain-containing protein [Solwaraspora sp. WMMD1047]|uniref:ABC transporter ATP-binding protein n=1 Tax=Solwaraspora sp. WMMD1047 TaxID=3016102 RepID=UPI0024161F03|nr:ATP-binding cassette domain-containing protein [Solwaraspora sp. WMMD1047]MDG4830615.1 ATP-binding cassette domain-containing protein [Solwaraspora sp. WMMD1047]
MRIGLRRRRSDLRETPATAGPELAKEPWEMNEANLFSAGFWAMARGMPALMSHALRLAWRTSRTDTTAAIVLNAVSGGFLSVGLLATTEVMQSLFAAGATPDRVRAALPSLLLVAVVLALRASCQAAASWAQARLLPRIERAVELRLIGLTTRVDLASYDDERFHDGLQRARERGTANAPVTVRAAIEVFSQMVGLVAVAVTLGVLHPVLLPLLILTAAPDWWAAVRSARMRYRAMWDLISSRRRKWIMLELMTDRRSAADVRSFTMRDFLQRQYDRVATVERDVQIALAHRETGVRLAGDALSGAATGVTYAALGLLLGAGAIALEVAGTAVLAIRSGKESLHQLVQAMNRLYTEGLYFCDYLDFCAEAERILTLAPSGTAPALLSRISVRDVTFRYPGAAVPALTEVSIDIDQGEVVALVGENGSGKTTLAKILAGLYTPDSGAVRWDGASLADADRHALWANIAVVAQNPTNWPLTARENIAMGDAGDDPRLRRAAAAAGAATFVERLPNGYDTLLDKRFESGRELSGGQWQRLAAARGFYRDAQLLICDEPSAALDARAEHELFRAIGDHAAGRTVVLITHRLANVRYADRIYVLADGRVTASGTHDQLMAAGGLYAELYNLQAEAYRPEPVRESPDAQRSLPSAAVRPAASVN